MPKISETPPALRPYRFHGVHYTLLEGRDQAAGECPCCGREGKWHVNINNGLWNCKGCAASGNTLTFLRHLWQESDKATTDYVELAQNRRLLHEDTLMHWGVVRSIRTGDWLVPGFSTNNRLLQLYRYGKEPGGQRWRLLPTPQTRDTGTEEDSTKTVDKAIHALHGVNLFDKHKPDVYLCEGPWDGMALWEVLRLAKETPEGLRLTGSESNSLAAKANVLACPGCNIFYEKWCELLAGKRVFLMFDNDHPVENPTTKHLQDPAAYAGMRRVAQLLATAEEPPLEVHYLQWAKTSGDPGGVHDPNRPHGYDVRDFLTLGAGKNQADTQERIQLLGGLLDLIQPIPADWVAGRSPGSRKKGSVELECLECKQWSVLKMAWKRAMHWTEGLDRALSVMLACATSTRAVGDQLWCKIIGPASCGKSVLCEALSVNKKYVTAKSTIRGFHSGFKSDRAGAEDNSLLSSLKDKTLVTKDGDTLLQAPNLSQILSEARDIYDRVSRTHYRNKMSKDYEGYSMTWLLCGTSSLRSLDSSELGERFLDCVIVETIDPEEEESTAMRVARRAARNMSLVSDGKAESRDDAEMLKAKQLTGGYVNYLRENAQSLLDGVEEDDASLAYCVKLGTFVAYIRARPSSKQEEKAEREMSYRLTSQMVRLAKCLAVVLNKRTMNDPEVMRRVKRVALDTARGRTLELVRHMYDAGPEGSSGSTLALLTNQTEAKERILLQFLRKIGAVELYDKGKDPITGVRHRPKWRLTAELRKLYATIMEPEGKLPGEET